MLRIKEILYDVKNRFMQYSQREQSMIVIGVSVVVLYLGYVLLVHPFNNHLVMMRKDVKADQTLLAWMQGAESIMMNLNKAERTRLRPKTLVAFLSILKQGVQNTSLTKSLSQLKQAGADSIEMHFQNVNFDEVIRFLSSIMNQHEVHVAQFNATAAGQPGQANIDIVMKVVV